MPGRTIHRDVIRFGTVFLVLAGATLMLAAAPPRLDLGAGLRYARVHRLPADLPDDAFVSAHPLVLDLRYVRGGAADGAGLARWLKAHAALRRPILLLVNRQTGPALLSPLASAAAVPGVVILGPDTAGFSVDVAVAADPDRERRAYDALERGTPADRLIDGNPPKARNDEARLAREHLTDAQMQDDDASDDKAPKWKPPLTDLALQRAVELHRALQALKRI
jgi:hypothetical protein